MWIPDTEYDNLHVADDSLVGADVSGSTFVGCVFDKAELANASLVRTTFERCRFVGCDLSNSDMSDASLDTVMVQDSKLLGMNFAGATLLSVHVVDSLSKLVGFFRSSLRDVSFVGSDLTEADFREATVRSSAFVRCDLSSVSFVNADVRQVDIRESVLDGSIPLTQCRGFVVNSTQLIPLAAALVREVGATLDDSEVPPTAELPGGREVAKLQPVDPEVAEQGLRAARARLHSTGTTSHRLFE